MAKTRTSFQKGREKTGGNVKGSKHRSTEIRDYVKFEPVEKIAELLKSGNLKDSEKAKILVELSKYFYKTPKDQIDLNLNGGVEIQKVFIDQKTKAEAKEHIKEFIEND